jgi:TolB-like protein/tRNA A-37 threonylcarbamoyl transferase component Bud32
MADAASAGGSPEADLAFAHYRVSRRPDGSLWELGRGAMGVTYKAFDEQLRVDVALKVITPGQVDDARAQALFLREARAAARVHHSNVASVVHLNTTPGNVFYAMEFIAGESLADWLRIRGALPPAMAIGFATQIARGLGAIHEQHIVHRDLKPANLMIVAAGREKSRVGSDSNPGAWQIKIIDFGLARGFGGEALGTEVDAQTIGFRGTALYASPEQCEEHGEIDGRSDQYSLGCILWEMLIGAPPFRGRNHRELLNQHVAMPVPLRRLAHLPGGLQAVVARMLVKDPASRFADADAVANALERCRERLAQNDEQIEDVGLTTREADATPAPAATENPATGVVIAGSVPAARSRTTAFALACTALLIVGTGWFFSRGRSAVPAPTAVSATPPLAAISPTISPSPAPAELQRKTVAVLPFQNISGRPEDAYLADGLQEEILNALARLRDLKVISRTSVMEFRGTTHNIREIGQRLGAGTILEGSVQHEGNKVRLTVQLIDARNDQHLLAASYDRELNKVLDLQSAVAKQVADALAATLTRQERGELDRVSTNNGDAYDRYLRATALFRQPTPDDEKGLVAPKQLLEEALRLDPDYADAYSLLSQANTWSYLDSNRLEEGAAAKQALDRAFAIDPRSPEAQLARGLYAMYVTKNLDQALADLGAVVKMRPNSAEAHQALGFALRRSGRMDEALEQFARSWDLDPLNKAYTGGPITTLLGLRRFDDAIGQTELFSARFPSEPDSYFARASIRAQLQGNSEPLKAFLRDYASLLQPSDHHFVETRIAVLEGRFLDADRIISETELPYFGDPIERQSKLAILYHAAGDADRAAEGFRRVEALEVERQQREPRAEPKLEKLSALAIAQSMLGKHETALATTEQTRLAYAETRDAVNGPRASYVRAFILVRAGRTEEGYAEVARLMRTPFGAPDGVMDDGEYFALLIKGDPRFEALVFHPPRL